MVGASRVDMPFQGALPGLTSSTRINGRVRIVIRRSFRRGLTLGVLSGALITAFRVVQARRQSPAPAAPPTEWPPIPGSSRVVVPEAHTVAEATTPLTPAVVAETPEKPKEKAAKNETEPLAPWVEPVEGACPETHPVKGKLTSSIFHVPGGFNYPRTKPDRCYLDAAAAEADGLRLSKR